jgi:hypothetical protein
MILWVVLFALVVAISFILAAQSMRDYSEDPEKDRNYSLFLIRNTQGLTPSVLSSIRNELSESKAIISFERLLKGRKSALVIFGPRDLVLNHKTSLDLLELEDYTNVSVEEISAWEAGIKKDTKITQKLFQNIPNLLENEQFWFQAILPSTLKPQLTGVFISTDESRRHTVTPALQNLSHEVHKLPKAFSNAQLLEFYQKRSYRRDNKNHHLKEEEILQLLLI